MNRRNFVGAIAASTVLGACGLQSSKPFRIQLFGDSIMRGYLSGKDGQQAAKHPAALLQDAVDIAFGHGEIEVENRAVDGVTAGHLVAGTDGLNDPWPGSVSADLVLMNHGVNDASYTSAGLWSEAQYEDALRKIAVCPCPIVFLTPTPVNNSDPDFAPVMRRVARELGVQVIDVRQIFDVLPGWQQALSSDGIHFDDDGYRLMWKAKIIPELLPVINDLRREDQVVA